MQVAAELLELGGGGEEVGGGWLIEEEEELFDIGGDPIDVRKELVTEGGDAFWVE